MPKKAPLMTIIVARGVGIKLVIDRNLVAKKIKIMKILRKI